MREIARESDLATNAHENEETTRGHQGRSWRRASIELEIELTSGLVYRFYVSMFKFGARYNAAALNARASSDVLEAVDVP